MSCQQPPFAPVRISYSRERRKDSTPSGADPAIMPDISTYDLRPTALQLKVIEEFAQDQDRIEGRFSEVGSVCSSYVQRPSGSPSHLGSDFLIFHTAAPNQSVEKFLPNTTMYPYLDSTNSSTESCPVASGLLFDL